MEHHQRRTSPRKRTHSVANKWRNRDKDDEERGRSPSKGRKKSPLPRCDSITQAEHQRSGKKLKRACWSPIQPYETKETSKSEFPTLPEDTTSTPVGKAIAEQSFDEILASTKRALENKDWASMVEEETNSAHKNSTAHHHSKRHPNREREEDKPRKSRPKFHISDDLTKDLSSGVLRNKDRNSSSDSGSTHGSRSDRSEHPPRRSQRRIDGPACSSPLTSPRRKSRDVLSPSRSPIRSRDSSRKRNSGRSFPNRSSKGGGGGGVKTRLGDKPAPKDRLGYFTSKDTADAQHPSSNNDQRGPPSWFPDPKKWKEPKAGYADEETVARRQKDIAKGYDSEAYKRYIAEVPKNDRVNGCHPRTPNKHINVSRRSWDMQVRVWRKMIHVYVGDSASDASFLSTDSNYTGSSHDSSSVADASESGEQTDPDEVADLLADYDIDSRRGLVSEDSNTMQDLQEGRKLNTPTQEDTLTGACHGESGPVDFSALAGTAS